MRKTAVVSAAVLTVSVLATDQFLSRANERRKSADPPDKAERLEESRTRARSIRLFRQRDGRPEPVMLMDQPLLRYSDLARETTDGALWAWGDGGRPMALACLFVEPQDEGDHWNYELLSLADGPLRAEGRRGWYWAPAAGALAMSELEGAEEPAGGKAARLTQMRSLARNLTARETWRGDEFELRLLAQPIHRYADADAGIEDGAIFAFAYGTNPEILLFLECRADANGKRQWHKGFVRLSAAHTWVRSGEETVWEADEVRQWLPEEAYYSSDGPDAALAAE